METDPQKGSDPSGIVQKGNVTYLYGSQVLGKNPETGTKHSTASLSIIDNNSGTVTSINISDRAKAFSVIYSSYSTGITLNYSVASGEQAPNDIKQGFIGITGTSLGLHALRNEAHAKYNSSKRCN